MDNAWLVRMMLDAVERYGVAEVRSWIDGPVPYGCVRRPYRYGDAVPPYPHERRSDAKDN